MNKIANNMDGVIRIAMVAVAVLLQLILIGLLVVGLRQYALYIYMLMEIIGVVGALALVDKNRNSAFTVVWLLIFLLLPIFGHILYLLWGRSGTHSRKSKAVLKILSSGDKWLPHSPETTGALREHYPEQERISAFLQREGFPVYQNTQCRYFPLGEQQFEQMLQDMADAQQFIFLEYFIVSQGRLWDQIHEILRRKAAQGVEIRLLYDDFGSILTVPNHFIKNLTAEGIQVQRFNPVHRHLSRLYLNYRNHQKITVIDGHIGYTGGTNLADEYANLYEKHGHWKDTAIRLTGEAVWSLTVTFLQMWESESNQQEDYGKYRPRVTVTGDGFYQPFHDGPVNHPHNPAESAYRQIIHTARQYVWISSPYLIIDEIMAEALCTAAAGGVDVRILLPRVWDRWYVHMVTRSNYGKLIEAGVHIYEYTPGYIHAKTILSDDRHGITGSINMDYRSFYLHFENGVWICGGTVLKEMKQDMEQTFRLSEEISLEAWMERPWYIKLAQAFLRLFIPLM